MYDFTGKWVDAAISKKEILYFNKVNEGDSPLYYLSFDTRSLNGIALNNPAFDFVSPYGMPPIPYENNTIIIEGARIDQGPGVVKLYIYDLAATNPPMEFTGSIFHNVGNNETYKGESSFSGLSLSEQLPIVTLGRHLYSFYIDGKYIGVNKDGVDIETLTGAEISGKNALLNTSMQPNREKAFYNYGSTYIFKSGILSIEPTADNMDIEYSWRPGDMSFLFTIPSSKLLFRNKMIFFKDGKDVNGFDPEIDTTDSMYFNGADYSARSVWMVGDYIYFSKNDEGSATSISTYKISFERNETEATIVSTSQVTIDNIIELSF
jgi:hypothetical protein